MRVVSTDNKYGVHQFYNSKGLYEPTKKVLCR